MCVCVCVCACVCVFGCINASTLTSSLGAELQHQMIHQGNESLPHILSCHPWLQLPLNKPNTIGLQQRQVWPGLSMCFLFLSPHWGTDKWVTNHHSRLQTSGIFKRLDSLRDCALCALWPTSPSLQQALCCVCTLNYSYSLLATTMFSR